MLGFDSLSPVEVTNLQGGANAPRRSELLKVIDGDGEVVASACGVPPEWLSGLAGSAAWALHEAASRAMLGTRFKVGC